MIQVHAVDAAGRRVVARSLKRDQFITWCVQLPANCVVAMEACSSAHHFARKLKSMGLDARMMAANFVAPYRMEGKTGKNDAADAAAICEAACLDPIAPQHALCAHQNLRATRRDEPAPCA